MHRVRAVAAEMNLTLQTRRANVALCVESLNANIKIEDKNDEK